MTRDDVVKLYIAMFDRAPEASAVNYWYKDALEHNYSIGELADKMLTSAIDVVKSYNLTDIYPQYINVNPDDYSSVKNVIEEVYKTLLNKDYSDDPVGIDYWVNEVLSGKKTLGETIASIEVTAEGIANGTIKLEDYGYTQEEINKTLQAAKAFENKIIAAKDISYVVPDLNQDNLKESLLTLQDTIKKINDDNNSITNTLNELKDKLNEIVPPEYKDKIQDMKEKIDALKDGEDVKPIIPVVDVDLNQNSFSDALNNNENYENTGGYDYNFDSENYNGGYGDDYGYEDGSYTGTDYIFSFPSEFREKYFEIEKNYIQDKLDLFKNNMIDKNFLDKLAEIEQKYEDKFMKLYNEYGESYMNEGVYKPYYDVLEESKETLNEERLKNISYLQEELNMLNNIDINNKKDVSNFFNLQFDHTIHHKIFLVGVDGYKPIYSDGDYNAMDHTYEDFNNGTVISGNDYVNYGYDDDGYGDNEGYNSYDDSEDYYEYYDHQGNQITKDEFINEEINMLKALPPSMVSQMMNLEKNTLQEELNAASKYDTITKDLIDEFAKIEQDSENQIKSLYDQYGLYYEKDEVLPDYSVLNQDPSVLQQIKNTGEKYLKEELNALNKADANNPESFKDFFELEEDSDIELDKISFAHDLTYNNDDETCDVSNIIASNLNNQQLYNLQNELMSYVNSFYDDYLLTINEHNEMIDGVNDILSEYGIDPYTTEEQCHESVGELLLS